MKKRINVSIDAQLHKSAAEWAANHNQSFSKLLEELLKKELTNEAVPSSRVLEMNASYSVPSLVSRIRSAPLYLQKQLSDYLDYLEYQSVKSSKSTSSENRIPPGFLRGAIQMSDDFNDTPMGFEDYL